MLISFYLLATTLVIFALAFFCMPIFKAKKISLFLPLGLFFILATALSYHFFGDFSGFRDNAESVYRRETIQAQLRQAGTPAELIAKLEQQLAKDPSHAQGWYLLGKLYYSFEQYDKAVWALQKANELQPDDLKIMLIYAQSLLLSSLDNAIQHASSLVAAILVKQPSNIQALDLQAIIALAQGNQQAAIASWTKITKILPIDDKEQAHYQEVIEKTRNL